MKKGQAAVARTLSDNIERGHYEFSAALTYCGISNNTKELPRAAINRDDKIYPPPSRATNNLKEWF
jgi:hypothetical protein